MVSRAKMWNVALVVLSCNASNGGLLISQYAESEPGGGVKGIELWNTMPVEIDFSLQNLDVLKGTNGGALSSDFMLDTGTLSSGEVMVIGNADVGTYMTSSGLGDRFFLEPFTFNGNDALQVSLGGVVQDTFGTPGSDPGSSWDGGGVSTRDQNIALRAGITTGDLVGWTDPSIRFETISGTPSAAGGLSGFGVAPTVVPEPSAFILLAGAAMISVLSSRRTRSSLTVGVRKVFSHKS